MKQQKSNFLVSACLLVVLAALTLHAGIALAASVSNDEPSMLNLGIAEEESVSRGNLNCSSPILLTCGVPYNGNTSGQPNNVNSYNCSGWNESGPEMVHRIYANTNGVMHVTVSNMPVDLDVFLLNPCDENYCLTYGDDYFDWNMVAGTFYYIVVDGYGGNISTYTLNATCATYTPTLTPSPSPTVTRTPTSQPTISPTLTPSSVPTYTPTNTSTFSPTMTLSPTDTPTRTPTGSFTATFTPTLTPTGTVLTSTPTRTPTRTMTPTVTPTPTGIPIPATTPLGSLAAALIFSLLITATYYTKKQR